jgi:hypothetical protein
MIMWNPACHIYNNTQNNSNAYPPNLFLQNCTPHQRMPDLYVLNLKSSYDMLFMWQTSMCTCYYFVQVITCTKYLYKL